MSYVSAPKPQGESSENEFVTNLKISQPLTIISISSSVKSRMLQQGLEIAGIGLNILEIQVRKQVSLRKLA